MPVLINLGRLLMLGVWAFLIFNLVHPFPRPMNIFVNVAFVFTTFMHALQMVMLKNGLPPVPTHWDLHREKVAGQVAYRLYHRQAQGGSDAGTD